MPTCNWVLAELHFSSLPEMAVLVVARLARSAIRNSFQLSHPLVPSKFMRYYRYAAYHRYSSVTSVGGTRGIPETAAFFSGGGFSNLFAIPSYQSAAVSSYLKRLGTTNAGQFNVTGRAFPDLSAQSINFQIVEHKTITIGTTVVFTSGTSCSTPTVASIFALLNDRLIAAGKSPLGFLNALIYSTAAAAAFNDITSGELSSISE